MSHAFHASNPNGSVEALAASQYGLITRDQAIELGIGRGAIDHRISTGRWEKVLPGVYRLAGSPQTWRQELMGTVLWAGDGAAVSHEAAGALLGMDGFVEGPVEISTTKDIRSDLAVVHRTSFGMADRTAVGGISVTSAARTVVDLAGVVDSETLRKALDSCLRKGLVTLTRMRWQVRQSQGKKGISVLRDLLEERSRDGVTDSDLELGLLQRIKAAGVPMPVLQFQIPGVGRVDIAYLQLKLVIEVDSYGWHFDRDAFREDRARDRALARIGWRVARVTEEDFDEIVEDLRRALCSETDR